MNERNPVFPLWGINIRVCFGQNKTVDGSRAGLLRWMKYEDHCHGHNLENNYVNPEPPKQLPIQLKDKRNSWEKFPEYKGPSKMYNIIFLISFYFTSWLCFLCVLVLKEPENIFTTCL